MKNLLFLISWLLVTVTPVTASYISLTTTLSSKVEDQNLKVAVSVTNKGDESAYNVQAELVVNGKQILSEKKAELTVNSSYQFQTTIPISKTKPGTYPLVLILHYTDANQYPFSALTCQTFAYKREATPPIFGQLKPVTFSKEGKLHFSLKNLSDSKIKVKTYLVVPKELTTVDKEKEIVSAPRSEQSLNFLLKNFSALAGSTYQVFAISETEDREFHYTSISPGTVKIVTSSEIFGLGYSAILIILAVLLIIFIGAQFLKWKK